MTAPVFLLALTLLPGKTEVVIPENPSAALRLAAAEATNFLSRAFAVSVPLVSSACGREGTVSICLGDGPGARRAGIDVAKLPRDAFDIRVTRDAVYIAGRDAAGHVLSDEVCPLKGEAPWMADFERGTLFGVYEFLERFVGCRFYFPGELGEIVPRRSGIEIPEGAWREKPDFTVRRYGYRDGTWPKEVLETTGLDEIALKRLDYFRNRMETEYVPCSHGLRAFRLVDRFGTAHPEYFGVAADGSRLLRPERGGSLCFASAVTNEIFRDIRAYLRGENPQGRGFRSKSWDKAFRGRTVDVMPPDAMTPCRCGKCAYNPHDADCSTEDVWRFTASLARRLKAEGFKDFRLTQMAYTPYRRVPEVEIPAEVDVMLACGGPWHFRNAAEVGRDEQMIADWNEKLGGRTVWLWTYPGKAMELSRLRGVPCVAPAAFGGYYKRLSGRIHGAFAESETENRFHQYLNYHVFGKVCWNNRTDVRALLAEHHRLMYGKASGPMSRAWTKLELAWTKGVAGRSVESSLGPVTRVPPPITIWREVYSEAFLTELADLLDEARSLVEPGSLESRRIALFRGEYLTKLAAARAEAMPAIDRIAASVHDTRASDPAAKPFWLRPVARWGHQVLRGNPGEIEHCRVHVDRTPTSLVFTFDCDEPRLGDRIAEARLADDPLAERDDGVEVYLDPTMRRESFHRLIVTSRGVLSDCRGEKSGERTMTESMDWGWDSHAKVSIYEREGGCVYRVEVPLASLPPLGSELLACFCRNRFLRGEPPVNRFYLWGSGVCRFDDVFSYSTIRIGERR